MTHPSTFLTIGGLLASRLMKVNSGMMRSPCTASMRFRCVKVAVLLRMGYLKKAKLSRSIVASNSNSTMWWPWRPIASTARSMALFWPGLMSNNCLNKGYFQVADDSHS